MCFTCCIGSNYVSCWGKESLIIECGGMRDVVMMLGLCLSVQTVGMQLNRGMYMCSS